MHEVVQRTLNILLVEEDSAQRDEIARLLHRAENPSVEVAPCDHLAEALERMSSGGIDLVLLGLDLPDSQGVVTFERANAFAPDIPIIVLADRDDVELATNAVRGGAQDYLAKSRLASLDLIRSMRYAIERHRLLGALRSLSLIDDLTGLYNRRGFETLGAQQLKLARRMARGVLLVHADLDRFKTINDTLGHHVGDRALLEVTELLRASFRGSDLIARLSGDDFVVLAMEASHDDAVLLEDRLRSGIRSFNQGGREPYQLAVSLGVARFDPDAPVELEELLEAAEARVLAEKQAKRPVVTGG